MKIDFKILGTPWVMKLLSTRQYVRRHGYESVAATLVSARRIDLSPQGRDLETITHELVHAYLSELCTHSADLARDAFEEIFAELMAKRGVELLLLADFLHGDVAKLQRQKKP